MDVGTLARAEGRGELDLGANVVIIAILVPLDQQVWVTSSPGNRVVPTPSRKAEQRVILVEVEASTSAR